MLKIGWEGLSYFLQQAGFIAIGFCIFVCLLSFISRNNSRIEEKEKLKRTRHCQLILGIIFLLASGLITKLFCK